MQDPLDSDLEQVSVQDRLVLDLDQHTELEALDSTQVRTLARVDLDRLDSEAVSPAVVSLPELFTTFYVQLGSLVSMIDHVAIALIPAGRLGIDMRAKNKTR